MGKCELTFNRVRRDRLEDPDEARSSLRTFTAPLQAGKQSWFRLFDRMRANVRVSLAFDFCQRPNS